MATMTEKQKNTTYAFYMIMSSYFKSAACKNPSFEKKLYLSYQELKESQQIQLEQKCISLIEHEILPHVSVLWENKDIDVYFQQNENNLPVILFVGKGFHYDITLLNTPSLRIKVTEFNLFLH